MQDEQTVNREENEGFCLSKLLTLYYGGIEAGPYLTQIQKVPLYRGITLYLYRGYRRGPRVLLMASMKAFFNATGSEAAVGLPQRPRG